MTLLTVNEVCARFRISSNNVLAWIHSGELPATNVASRTGPGCRPSWRISEEDLVTFLAARRERPKGTVSERRQRTNRRRKLPEYTRYF